MYLCQLDTAGFYVRHVPHEIGAIAPTEPGWVRCDPPEYPEANNLHTSSGWLVLPERPEAAPWLEPTVPADPVRISVKAFRERLLPKEAALYRSWEAESPMTAEEVDEVFNLNTTTFEKQVKLATQDGIHQFRELLTEGVIELDHPDTHYFLVMLGYRGMFGADADTRIPVILTPPQ